jgi:hypothetical protein
MTKRSYKKKKQTKNFSFVYILLILIAVAGLTVLVMSFLVPPKKKDVDTTPMNTAINETEKKQEEKKKEEEKIDNGENPDKTPEKYDGENPISSDSFNASIIRNEVSNGKVIIRVGVYELVEGTCTLHMETADGSTVDRTAKLVNAGPDSSACEGFDIPVDGIAKGTYKFTVTIKNDAKKSVLNGVITI